MRSKKRGKVQYRKPTNKRVQAAEYNYGTATGEKEERTMEEAKGYIE
jgi:hypothetical protein